MSGAKWTVERLDALPEGTVVQIWLKHWECWQTLVWNGEFWLPPGSEEIWESRGLAGGNIRVVSVPIDALMADETLTVALEAGWVPDGFGCWSSERAIRAAIAHATGEATV